MPSVPRPLRGPVGGHEAVPVPIADTVSSLRGQELLGRLADAGYRLTRARRALVNQVASSEKLLSVSELVACGAAVGVSRPTVFRLLEVLLQLHLAVRFTEDNGSRTFYAFCGAEHHHHLVCTACRHVEPVELPSLEHEVGLVSSTLGYALTSHAVELFGLCPDCKPENVTEPLRFSVGIV